MLARILLLLILLVQPTYADQWIVLKPPAWADHEPTRPYTLKFKTQRQVNKKCESEVENARKVDPGANALGCADIVGREIWIVRGLSEEVQQQVIRHEKAHLNGWFH